MAAPILRRRVPIPRAAVPLVAAAAPVALCVAVPRTRRRDIAVCVLQMWAYVSAYKIPHDDPEALERRVRIDYPIAVDNNYGTWDAYNNNYWPAEYLIDPRGQVRAYDFGESGYATMESNIRSLLTASGVAKLPARTDVPDKTPTSMAITPESYVGYAQLNNEVGTAVVNDQAANYRAPSTIPANSLAFNGTWTVRKEEATSGPGASLDLQFTADNVYLVMAGQGTVGVSYNGRHLTTVTVAGIPKLYTLLSGSHLQSGLLTLSVSPGVEAYDFTFG